ncbi:MAG: response regulator [Gammaproteobacteria bacterium]|nr:MAG: response regulator [Gammaproteobacteria bacterium]
MTLSISDKAILIVDDMDSMRQLLKAILRDGGCKNIAEASNGSQALELAKSRYYDLIISDWNMPKMDGLEFLQSVRLDDKIKDTLFLMVTSESEKENVVKAIQARVDGYVIKPFTQITVTKQVIATFAKQIRFE